MSARVGRFTWRMGDRGFGISLRYCPLRNASVAWRLSILCGHTVREFYLFRRY